MGGTIASTNTDRGGEEGGVTPTLDAGQLIRDVPGLSEIAQLEAVTFRQLPSGDLVLADLITLATEITDRFNAGATAGVVITQGTDTIEETSFALDLLVPDVRPVVVTGAMRNPTLAGPDGPANLLAAVQVAMSREATGLGTLVVFNDEIHAARFVRKTHTSNPATFHSPSAGPLGWIVEGRPRIAFRPCALEGIPLVGNEVPAVGLLRVTLGDDGRMIERIEALGFAGLVLEGLGGGHVPARMAPLLGNLATRMPVVLASRTGGGEILRESYGFAGSERDLLSRGLISAGVLDGLKARILLSLVLHADSDLEAVRQRFEKVNRSVCY